MDTRIETVAAASTPAGKSAIGVIRLSGSKTFEILKHVFKPKGKRTFPSPFAAFSGTIHDPSSGLIVDQVVVTTYASPASYTGEDLAEIGVHGNPVVMSSVLSTLFGAGAIPAEAGEFTRRAFLNGKMDLLDVEAVAQILDAASQSQASIALNQLEGAPSKVLSHIRHQLLEYLTHIEAGINFPEDAIEDLDEKKMSADFSHGIQELSRFHEAAKRGGMVASGLSLALIGKPNTGKSSLLNLILGRERAIVTDIPGTTRDTLEETWHIGGFPVKIIDTAGIRKPGDPIEAIGIERTKKAIDNAFLILALFDASAPMSDEDLQLISLLKSQGKPVLLVLNKMDLPARLSTPELPEFPQVSLSATTGEGLGTLMSAVEKILLDQGFSSLTKMVLLGAQQTDALARALASLTRARDGVGTMYHDLLSVDVSDTIRYLGMVTGETIDVDTLDRIFERFCIGK